MACCDICGKRGTSLIELYSTYATEDIQQICSDCESIVDGQLRKIREIHAQAEQSLLKLIMENLKEVNYELPTD